VACLRPTTPAEKRPTTSQAGKATNHRLLEPRFWNGVQSPKLTCLSGRRLKSNYIYDAAAYWQNVDLAPDLPASFLAPNILGDVGGTEWTAQKEVHKGSGPRTRTRICILTWPNSRCVCLWKSQTLHPLCH